MSLEPDKEQSYPPHALPAISEETRKVLVAEVGGSNQEQDIPEGKLEEAFMRAMLEQRQRGETPAQMAHSMADRVFNDINQVNPILVRRIYELLAGRYKSEFSQKPQGFLMDTTTIGMATVLRAFDIESGYQLIGNLGRINTEEDLDLVKSVIEAIIPPERASDVSILENIVTMPRIPDHQVNLNFGIREAARSSQGGKNVNRGAVAMYSVLSRLWPKLIPDSGP